MEQFPPCCAALNRTLSALYPAIVRAKKTRGITDRQFAQEIRRRGAVGR
jgi:hypothetical protein